MIENDSNDQYEDWMKKIIEREVEEQKYGGMQEEVLF